jgi:8-oxo-dGTP pyrophosphatase MutT (NUDIX family)
MGSTQVGYVEALRVRPDTLLGVYTGDAHTYANRGRGAVRGRPAHDHPVGGRLTPEGIETGGLAWFPLDDPPSPILAPHEELLDDLRNGKRGIWT